MAVHHACARHTLRTFFACIADMTTHAIDMTDLSALRTAYRTDKSALVEQFKQPAPAMYGPCCTSSLSAPTSTCWRCAS